MNTCGGCGVIGSLVQKYGIGDVDVLPHLVRVAVGRGCILDTGESRAESDGDSASISQEEESDEGGGEEVFRGHGWWVCGYRSCCHPPGW